MIWYILANNIVSLWWKNIAIGKSSSFTHCLISDQHIFNMVKVYCKDLNINKCCNISKQQDFI